MDLEFAGEREKQLEGNEEIKKPRPTSKAKAKSKPKAKTKGRNKSKKLPDDDEDEDDDDEDEIEHSMSKREQEYDHRLQFIQINRLDDYKYGQDIRLDDYDAYTQFKENNEYFPPLRNCQLKDQQ